MTRAGRFRKVAASLLASRSIHPVLLDIGASGSPPRIWHEIAPYSIYVGFDPDKRGLPSEGYGGFHRSEVLTKAVTDNDEKTVRFFLAKSSRCSSTLRPDSRSLSNYLFGDLFAVEREEVVPATSLDAALDRVGLEHVDWLKTDSQGTDLRLYCSLKESIRSGVLAVDVEPGLTDSYVGEDLFVETHKRLTADGFWLSRLDIGGSVRMRQSSVERVGSAGGRDTRGLLERNIRKSPVWCEARYLRTTDWLAVEERSERDFVLLWLFALLDEQPGFALDVAAEFERKFGGTSECRMMFSEALVVVEGTARRSRFTARGIVNAFRWRIRRLCSRRGAE